MYFARSRSNSNNIWNNNYDFVFRQKTGPSFSDSGPVECSAPPTYQSEKMPYYKY